MILIMDKIFGGVQVEVIDFDVSVWPWKTRVVDDVARKACRHHIKAFARRRNTTTCLKLRI